MLYDDSTSIHGSATHRKNEGYQNHQEEWLYLQTNYNRQTENKKKAENIVSQTEDKQEENRTTTTQIIVPINKPTEDKTRALQEKEVALDYRQGAKHPEEMTVVKTVNKNVKSQVFQKLEASPDEENATRICDSREG